ncbi:MAG: acyl-CoA dehydrogenase [Elusimicrobia bacterium]|nr:acyl-CoA dehydrogenase [Elusimicrobiota bacterium]
MDYGFTEEQLMIQELARQIAEERVRPVRAQLDEEGSHSAEIMQVLAESDLFAVFIPEEYGGLGGGALELCIATEELSKVCGGVAVSYAATALGAYPIMLGGSDEQKKKYLPAIASGEKLAAFGITEPNAGSDAGGVETTAEKDGDSYILNGSKIFITNGGVADIYTVIAMTDRSRGARGASCFILEKGMEGFEFGKEEDKMGIRASATRELIFTDCRVPAENLISREGMGFILSMRTFDHSRPGIGAQAVGIAQGALNEAVDYASERIQFGQPVSSFQAIRHLIADMATKVEAARTLVYQAARQVDSGAKNISKLSAMSKLFASEIAMEVTTNAVQIFGGYGYMREYPAEKFMRDAKITQIYEGTSQIQREVIGLEVIKEAKFRDKK